VVEEGSRGHQQMVLIVLDQPALYERVKGTVDGRASDELRSPSGRSGAPRPAQRCV
jgi:hypothetical protein